MSRAKQLIEGKLNESFNTNRANRSINNIEKNLESVKYSLDKLARNPDRFAPQSENIEQSLISMKTSINILLRLIS